MGGSPFVISLFIIPAGAVLVNPKSRKPAAGRTENARRPPDVGTALCRPLCPAPGGHAAGGPGNPAPTAGNVPSLSLRDQSADWSWQSVTPVPISNVFKSQFENTTIFNSRFARGRGACGEQCSPLRAGMQRAGWGTAGGPSPPPTGGSVACCLLPRPCGAAMARCSPLRAGLIPDP